MSNTAKFKYNFTDHGFCQVHFTIMNKLNQRIHYCLMEDGNKVELYRTTGPDWYEADYRVEVAKEAILEFETPSDEYGKSLVNRYNEGK